MTTTGKTRRAEGGTAQGIRERSNRGGRGEKREFKTRRAAISSREAERGYREEVRRFWKN